MSDAWLELRNNLGDREARNLAGGSGHVSRKSRNRTPVTNPSPTSTIAYIIGRDSSVLQLSRHAIGFGRVLYGVAPANSPVKAPKRTPIEKTLAHSGHRLRSISMHAIARSTSLLKTGLPRSNFLVPYGCHVRVSLGLTIPTSFCKTSDLLGSAHMHLEDLMLGRTCSSPT